EPGSLLDVLSIVEHPAFQSFYDDLINEGLAGTTGDDTDGASATGDVIAAGLREGFEAFDFGLPFILREADEVRDHQALDISTLPAFNAMTLAQLTGLLGKGDTFISQDLQSATLFGDYRVDGAVMNVSSYNDFLARLTRRISQALSHPLPKGNKVAHHAAAPYLQVNTAELTGLLGKGDTFISQDLQSATLFGDYRVDGAVMNVSSYNDFLARLTRRIAQALSHPLPKGNKVAHHAAAPYLQVNTAELTGWLDDYIWTQLFDAAFNPMEDENWRVLLLQPVVDHITKVFAVALIESEQQHVTGQTEVYHRQLSEVPALMLRESHSVEVAKCIYTRLGWPSRNGGLERAFIHWAQADSGVQAFCKISENRHAFARLRYVKDDGLPAFYSPDFLVRTAQAVYLVETKAQQQTIHPNVQRKLKAATAWCQRINDLSADLRTGLPWHYVLLAEDVVYEWQGKGARLAELLEHARLRPLAEASLQGQLL
ncbi:MAG: Tn7 transposase TnsA N-terminal domain-containing protein, partial [Pseudomonadota bacterium]|nr:Tn7 transposase TnsA N-terminal domain-containing protein [Pseudomonadota bacterium]